MVGSGVSGDDLSARLRAVEDRLAVEDVICAVTLHSDHGEWEEALSLYAPDAMIDYSSVSGPDNRNVPVAEHRRRLLTYLPGFDKRQHQTTNFEITVKADEAQSRAQVRAIHTLGTEAWVVYGTYHHRLARTAAGWRITYQRADLVRQEGEHLIDVAKRNVLARGGRS
jgi:hypothetical protein